MSLKILFSSVQFISFIVIYRHEIKQECNNVLYMLKTPKEISRTASLWFRSLGSVSFLFFLFLKEIKTFSKDALNLLKVSLKTLYYVTVTLELE